MHSNLVDVINNVAARLSHYQYSHWRRELKKLASAGSCIAIFQQTLHILDGILPHSCKFSTAEIMSAQN